MNQESEDRKGKIVVFGATGRSGSAVVELALARGYSVTAFVRDPAKVTHRDPKLRVIRGDVLDPEAVERAVRGHETVVSCIGAGLKGSVRSEGTRNIISAMEATGVKRLLSQSTLGAGDSRDNLNFYWKHIMFGLLLRNAYADHNLQEKYIRESGLDWTIFRPGALTEGAATGQYAHGFLPTDRRLSLKISIADLARFVIDQIEDATYLHRAPGLSYWGAQ